MAFNCDFNAPQFCDFENLDNSGNADDFFETQIEDGEKSQSEKRPTKSEVLVNPLKPLNFQQTPNTTVDHLRPKMGTGSSLKTINKSAPNKHITKQQAELMLQRLVPSGQTLAKKTKFVSLAEETKKYFGTPERFRRARRPRASSADAHLRHFRKRSPSPATTQLTMPASPRLLTRGRSRCNHKPEQVETKKSGASSKLASLKKRVFPSSSSQVPNIKHTATSKMREEKAKNSGPLPLKQPLKTVMHNGIPIMLHNIKVQNKPETKKNLPPVPANSVHFKLYEQDKEIRAKLEREREKEMERERQMAQFTAKQPVILSKRPFLPKQCDKEPVKPLDLQLHSEIRSEERKQFDLKMKEKEAALEAAKQQEMERKEKEDEMELAKQREQTVHKPVPIKKFQAVEIKRSGKPLTLPMTPNFALRKRHKSSD